MSREGTAPASARAHGVATNPSGAGNDISDAVSVLTLAIHAAGLAIQLQSTAVIDAGDACRTIEVGGAAGVAHGGRASIVPARRHCRWFTRAKPVASPGRVHRRHTRARGRTARTVFGIEGAAAKAVTHARPPAGRWRLLRTQRVGQPRGNRGARSLQSKLVAGTACAPAGGIAANPVDTIEGRALLGFCAGGSRRLRTAAATHASATAHAICVTGTRPEALTRRRIARKRRAHRRRPQPAMSVAVAHARVHDGVSFANARNAHGSRFVFAALSRAIAHAVEATGRNSADLALAGGARFETRGCQSACSERRRQRARLTSAATRGVAAKTVRAEAARALSWTCTRLANRLATIARVVHTHHRRRAIKPDRLETGRRALATESQGDEQCRLRPPSKPPISIVHQRQVKT